jgi:hypothetical protein
MLIERGLMFVKRNLRGGTQETQGCMAICSDAAHGDSTATWARDPVMFGGDVEPPSTWGRRFQDDLTRQRNSLLSHSTSLPALRPASPVAVDYADVQPVIARTLSAITKVRRSLLECLCRCSLCL